MNTQTLGDSIRRTSYQERLRNVHFYSPTQLLELVQYREISLNVSDLKINVEHLAEANWSCRITHSVYGGRSRVVFLGKNNRSTITFRISKECRHLNDIDLLELLDKTGEEATLSSSPKFVQYVTVSGQNDKISKATDLQLLEQVEQNIKARLLKKPTKKKLLSKKAEILIMGAAG